jgi:hypothetical protein
MMQALITALGRWKQEDPQIQANFGCSTGPYLKGGEKKKRKSLFQSTIVKCLTPCRILQMLSDIAGVFTQRDSQHFLNIQEKINKFT